MNLRVKICGITSLADALAAVEAGADALGFMFYDASPRRIQPVVAAAIIHQLPPHVVRVGVFVNAPEAQLRRTAGECRLDVLQLHGNEPPGLCARLAGPPVADVLGPVERGPEVESLFRVVKAFRIRNEESLRELPAYDGCGGWLLDSCVAGQPGGTGVRFNWDLAVQAKQAERPIILAGGLTPDNVAEAVRQVRPYAVDVSSGVELAPGRKDPARLRAFVTAARGA